MRQLRDSPETLLLNRLTSGVVRRDCLVPSSRAYICPKAFELLMPVLAKFTIRSAELLSFCCNNKTRVSVVKTA